MKKQLLFFSLALFGAARGESLNEMARADADLFFAIKKDHPSAENLEKLKPLAESLEEVSATLFALQEQLNVAREFFPAFRGRVHVGPTGQPLEEHQYNKLSSRYLVVDSPYALAGRCAAAAIAGATVIGLVPVFVFRAKEELERYKQWRETNRKRQATPGVYHFDGLSVLDSLPELCFRAQTFGALAEMERLNFQADLERYENLENCTLEKKGVVAGKLHNFFAAGHRAWLKKSVAEKLACLETLAKTAAEFLTALRRYEAVRQDVRKDFSPALPQTSQPDLSKMVSSVAATVKSTCVEALRKITPGS
jgi:chaperone required for assembly of F1-ATPase